MTFPELAAPIDRAVGVTAEMFWKTWSPAIQVLAERDHTTLFGPRGGFLVGAVRLTPALWGELSEKTQHAIWRYLRTLILEAAMEVSMDGVATETMQALMGILTEERMEAGGAEAEAATAEAMEEVMGHLNPLMDKLKGFMGNFMDISGLKDIPMPEIPEHLRRGRIARLAEEMAKQFNPAEFGIDPALLSGDDVGEVLKRLAEMYQRDPTQLLAGAKRVAERIKKQIMGGTLNREELILEAQEFVALFKEHPLFKEAIAKFEGMTGGAGGLADLLGGSSSASVPSARRQAVQERLRKKLEARKAGKK